MSRGHVFITMGDITHMEVDAWLLPTDRELSLKDEWRTQIPNLDERVAASDTVALRDEKKHAAWLAGDGTEPAIVLATVPLEGVRDESGIEHIATSVRDFVSLASARVGVARHKRAKSLLAVPAFGTRGGGGAKLRGQLAERLLNACTAAAREHDVDIVIVLRDERSFARMQELRKRRQSWQSELSSEEVSDAERLAGLAKAGKLVPFLGAGVSMSGGAPSWHELLDQLAGDAGLDGVQRKALEGWSELDRAAYLRQRSIELHLEHGRTREEAAAAFAEAVVRLVDVPRYGLAPALLASLRTPQAITLNYDTLFERASEDAGLPRVRIPDDEGVESSPAWLLKLHGSVDKPASIVLTRDDYLGYASQREALSAIVKANLLTHHLLFVGFGLSDEHFHRIVHDVRRALPRPESMAERATALTLTADPIAAELWKGQVRMRPLGSGEKADGRDVELFLDVLVALATDAHSYLLKDDFGSSLSVDEVRLRDALRALQQALGGLPPTTAGHEQATALLRSLGAGAVG